MKNSAASAWSVVAAVLLSAVPLQCLAQTLEKPGPLGEPAKKLYRQVTPEGKVIYSDKPVSGAKLDDTLTEDPESSGHSWNNETGRRPTMPPRAESTPVSKVPTIPPVNRGKTLADADADVIKAEMLLEDAKKRREAGIEPLPGERTANAEKKGSRLNDSYQARQDRLAQDVAEMERMVKRARAERDSLRPAR